jgi:hypothetical protein
MAKSWNTNIKVSIKPKTMMLSMQWWHSFVISIPVLQIHALRGKEILRYNFISLWDQKANVVLLYDESGAFVII